MCVHFVNENAFQVIADRKGTFRNQGFANCLNPETNQWRIGEILQRGKDLQNFKETFCERKIRNYFCKRHRKFVRQLWERSHIKFRIHSI
jgi:hypothetical protein